MKNRLYKNVMEDLVEFRFDEIQSTLDCCTCEHCRNDIIGLFQDHDGGCAAQFGHYGGSHQRRGDREKISQTLTSWPQKGKGGIAKAMPP